MILFEVGSKYTREDVFRMLDLNVNTYGDWFTGYHKHEDEWFIFCNIGTPGRTGHEYPNKFIGDELVWYGRNTSRLNHPSIQDIINPENVGSHFLQKRR